jgi:hypothetical protein
VVIASDGSILVSGTASKKIGTTTQSGWLTRRSTNGGATWMDVDFVVNGWPSASISADSFGRVFAAGFLNTTPNVWLVRGSADGGATWVSTDSFANDGTTRAQAQAVAVDALGNVCVVGETGSTAATYAAPIRRLPVP